MKTALPLTVSLGMLTTMICLSIGMATALPPGAGIPVPFGFGTGAEGNAAPGLALSLMPLVVIVVTGLFFVLARTSLRTMEKPERFVFLWLAVILVLAIGHGLIIRGALLALHSA
jgi:hypothetical protein